MGFEGNPGVSNQQVTAVQAALGYNLPQDYVDFLRRFNGGEGFVGNEYLMLWRLEDLEQFNREYEVSEYVPGKLLFASNGGGESYGFCIGSWEVIRVPFIGMSPEDCWHVADSFSEFWRRLEQS